VVENGRSSKETNSETNRQSTKPPGGRRKIWRSAVTQTYTEHAYYVEANCNGDLATFRLSGFQAGFDDENVVPAGSANDESAARASITGQMKVKVSPVSKALSYTLCVTRLFPMVAERCNVGGTDPNQFEAVIMGNLTPGTVYTFQVRGLGSPRLH
jgi:hypothetical protein